MKPVKIRICVGSSCFARGNETNVELVEQWLSERGLTEDVDFDLSGRLCTNECARGPVVIVDGVVHTNVTAARLPGILADAFAGRAQ